MPVYFSAQTTTAYDCIGNSSETVRAQPATFTCPTTTLPWQLMTDSHEEKVQKRNIINGLGIDFLIDMYYVSIVYCTKYVAKKHKYLFREPLYKSK